MTGHIGMVGGTSSSTIIGDTNVHFSVIQTVTASCAYLSLEIYVRFVGPLITSFLLVMISTTTTVMTGLSAVPMFTLTLSNCVMSDTACIYTPAIMGRVDPFIGTVDFSFLLLLIVVTSEEDEVRTLFSSFF